MRPPKDQVDFFLEVLSSVDSTKLSTAARKMLDTYDSSYLNTLSLREFSELLNSYCKYE